MEWSAGAQLQTVAARSPHKVPHGIPLLCIYVYTTAAVVYRIFRIYV
jgi:hypothetical protein